MGYDSKLIESKKYESEDILFGYLLRLQLFNFWIKGLSLITLLLKLRGRKKKNKKITLQRMVNMAEHLK